MGLIEKFVNEVELDHLGTANEPKPLSSTGMSTFLHFVSGDLCHQP